jgi:soluble lytic murein transglycosylase
MAKVYRRRINPYKMIRRILFILFLALLLFNLDTVGRFFYPFPYRAITTYHAGLNELDPELLAAIMKAESGFDRRAVSARGARGLMQIMPDTGQWIARQMGEQNFHPDQLFEPEISIKMGAWYLADLKKEFNNDPVLFLAAYNGGRGNVKQWLSDPSLSAGGKGSDIERIPFEETRLYVKKVLQYYRIYNILYR